MPKGSKDNKTQKMKHIRFPLVVLKPSEDRMKREKTALRLVGIRNFTGLAVRLVDLYGQGKVNLT